MNPENSEQQSSIFKNGIPEILWNGYKKYLKNLKPYMTQRERMNGMEQNMK